MNSLNFFISWKIWSFWECQEIIKQASMYPGSCSILLRFISCISSSYLKTAERKYSKYLFQYLPRCWMCHSCPCLFKIVETRVRRPKSLVLRLKARFIDSRLIRVKLLELARTTCVHPASLWRSVSANRWVFPATWETSPVKIFHLISAEDTTRQHLWWTAIGGHRVKCQQLPGKSLEAVNLTFFAQLASTSTIFERAP